MSLSELSAALRKKDSEKTQILSEMRSLEDLKSKGYRGRLQGKLVNVQGLSKNEVEASASLSYTLSPPESGEEEADQSQLLKTTNIILSFKLDLKTEDDSNLVSFTAEFDCNELSDEGYTIAELEGKQSGDDESLQSIKKFSVKLSYDDFDKVVAHKMVELEQIQEHVQELGNSIKGRSNKTSEARDGKSHGGNSSSMEDEDDVVADSRSGSVDSMKTIALQSAGIAAAVLVEYRSFLLFGLSAIGIFFYGDYASI